MIELVLLLAGFAGGVLNALAGGGTFIVFPALLFAGVPPVLANASTTFASMPGYMSGVVGYWGAMRGERHRLVLYTALALVFGYLGAELLMHVSDAAFERAVPWLIGFAVLLFALGGRISAFFTARSSGTARMRRLGMVAVLSLLAAVCFYGGFFNAGMGILLLAALAVGGMTDIHAMNGLKLWISSAVALAAVLRFGFGGAIDWYHGGFTLVGITTGGYLAARLAHLIPQPLLRTLIIIYGVGLTIYFFWANYLG